MAYSGPFLHVILPLATLASTGTLLQPFSSMAARLRLARSSPTSNPIIGSIIVGTLADWLPFSQKYRACTAYDTLFVSLWTV